MQKFKTYELWLLDNYFQTFANAVWKRVPISCFQLGRIFLVGHCVLFSIEGKLHDTFIWDTCLELVIFSIGMVFTASAEKQTKPNFGNPYRYLYQTSRVFFLLSAIFSCSNWQLALGSIFNVYFIYMVCCTPPFPLLNDEKKIGPLPRKKINIT